MSERDSSFDEQIDIGADPKWRSVLKSIWRFVRTQPLGTVGILVILTIAFLAIFADYGHTSVREGVGRKFLYPPSEENFFGTNRNGQDLWSRVVYGARPALILGLGAVGVAMFVATLLALLAGFFGGIIDSTIIGDSIPAIGRFTSITIQEVINIDDGNTLLSNVELGVLDEVVQGQVSACLLYTSDAADE